MSLQPGDRVARPEFEPFRVTGSRSMVGWAFSPPPPSVSGFASCLCVRLLFLFFYFYLRHQQTEIGQKGFTAPYSLLCGPSNTWGLRACPWPMSGLRWLSRWLSTLELESLGGHWRPWSCAPPVPAASPARTAGTEGLSGPRVTARLPGGLDPSSVADTIKLMSDF